jgi:hypothetical protein
MALKYLVYDDEGLVNRLYSDIGDAMDKYYEVVNIACEKAAYEDFSDYIFISCGEELTDTSCWDIIESETVNLEFLKKQVAPWIRLNIHALKESTDKFIAEARSSLSDCEAMTVIRIIEELGVDVSKYL